MQNSKYQQNQNSLSSLSSSDWQVLFWWWLEYDGHWIPRLWFSNTCGDCRQTVGFDFPDVSAEVPSSMCSTSYLQDGTKCFFWHNWQKLPDPYCCRITNIVKSKEVFLVTNTDLVLLRYRQMDISHVIFSFFYIVNN